MRDAVFPPFPSALPITTDQLPILPVSHAPRVPRRRAHPHLPAVLCLTLVGLHGCAWLPPQAEPTRVVEAPVPPPVSLPAVPPPQPAPKSRPTQYKIKPGDSLIRIGLDLGYNWRDIAKLNQIKQPYPLQVGGILKLPDLPAEEVIEPSGAAAAREQPTSPAPVAVALGTIGSFRWPGGRHLLSDFATTGKGIEIDGKEGEPVRAAAAGRVVYAGTALPGYGQVVILKHDEVFLSAYGHNRRLLVKEGALVQQGDPIAAMGRSAAERVKLRFEIRREGVPVDPMAYLSASPQ